MSQSTNSPAVVAARLTELLKTLEGSAAELRKYLKTQSQDKKLKVDHPFAFFGDAQASNHASRIKIACERLDTLVTPPHNVIVERAGLFYRSTALDICLKHNVADHIRDLDKDGKGVPIEELGAAAKLDADLLGRLLRVLSTKGTFQEVEKGVFKNTLASSVMINDPEYNAIMDLWITDNGVGAPKLGNFAEELYRARISGSGSKTPSPFAMATGNEWYDYLPLNPDRAKNFNLAMRGQARGESTFSLPYVFPFADYDFSALPKGSMFVDVGGGVGTIAEILLLAYPNLKIVLQDMESVVKSATENPTANIKRFMDEGRLIFQVQDFFSDQPKYLDGAVFMLSNVLHNHRDANAVKLLKALRRSNPSRLLIVDRVLGPFFPTEATTPEGEQEIHNNMRASWEGVGTIHGVHVPPRSQVVPAQYDMVMATMFGAKTRRLEEWISLLEESGFSLLSLSPLRASSGQTVIEAVVRLN
ncbi:hypothetical protein CVT24_006331 [Panaeolus cyanescens]|uniref:Uncharacterized protein n=1 Tax=Panaeolus cyanescens TaxID=181874 RepID=A0A409YE78_9AGAR|nr:hypothetical protein CVT24_006331 [Panaeolus cyanescens]